MRAGAPRETRERDDGVDVDRPERGLGARLRNRRPERAEGRPASRDLRSLQPSEIGQDLRQASIDDPERPPDDGDDGATRAAREHPPDELPPHQPARPRDQEWGQVLIFHYRVSSDAARR